MTMVLGILTVAGLLAVCGALVALAIADLERRQEKWEWNHPPDDGGDGITEVKDDGQDIG